MLQHTTDLAAMAEALSRSSDYRVLRRLVPRIPLARPTAQETRTGILLDTETTGLNQAKDEIIELGMVKFDYTPDGRIVGVRDTFSAFNEPSAPISAEVTALTGITDEMVAGHKFDDAAVTDFVGDSVVTIAHNSGFDRRFVERYWPVFEHKAWVCSARGGGEDRRDQHAVEPCLGHHRPGHRTHGLEAPQDPRPLLHRRRL